MRAALYDLDRAVAALPAGAGQGGEAQRVTVALPMWRCVLVQAIERDPESRTFRELPVLALSRVPVQGECIAGADGRTLHVLGVRHLHAGDIAAELQVEHLNLPALVEGTADGEQLRLEG